MTGGGGGSGTVTISQVYGGGGNSGATYKNDFIELYNAGTTTVQYVVDNTPQQNVLGAVRRRVDDAEVDASWLRARYRSAFALTAGSGVEQYHYVGVPDGTIQLIDSTGITFASRSGRSANSDSR